MMLNKLTRAGAGNVIIVLLVGHTLSTWLYEHAAAAFLLFI
jgi:hypothetical protein